MHRIKKDFDALFNSAGRKYEVLTYEKFRDPVSDRTPQIEKELALIDNLLTALAPFKEEINKLEDYDI